MKDKILQLCKRLNKFTLDEIATISEIPADNLLPVLNELICENKLSLENNIYSYQKKQNVSDKYAFGFEKEIDTTSVNFACNSFFCFSSNFILNFVSIYGIILSFLK